MTKNEEIKKRKISIVEGIFIFVITIIIFFLWGFIVRLFLPKFEKILFNQWTFMILVIVFGIYFERRRTKHK